MVFGDKFTEKTLLCNTQYLYIFVVGSDINNNTTHRYNNI